jgi:C4-dicarboxylate transporter DctM subunit
VIYVLCIAITLLALVGVPIAYAMGMGAMITFATFLNHLPMEVVAQRIVNAVDKFPMVAVALFILGGELMNTGGLTTRLIRLSNALFGWIKGGLGLVTVGAGIFLSGISGSATADAAALGKTLIPGMRRQGYDEGLAASIVASAASLGPIIPPSIVMIIYASMTNISIGKLFLAGVLPGLLIGLILMLCVIYYAYRLGYERERWAGFQYLWEAVKGSAGPMGAPLIILVGVVGGYFSSTETGAILVLYAAILGWIYKEMSWAKIFEALCDTALNVGLILFIIAVSSVMGWILAMGGLPAQIGALIAKNMEHRAVVLLILIAILTLLALALDGVAIMVILVPIFVPMGVALQMDPVQLAMIIILCAVVGGITPPVGVTLYVACRAGGVSLEKANRRIWVFVFAITAAVLAVAFVPALSMALPEAAFGARG